jgi:hypothetical protein
MLFNAHGLLRFVLFLEQVAIGDDGQVHIVSTRVVFYNEDIHYTGNTTFILHFSLSDRLTNHKNCSWWSCF